MLINSNCLSSQLDQNISLKSQFFWGHPVLNIKTGILDFKSLMFPEPKHKGDLGVSVWRVVVHEPPGWPRTGSSSRATFTFYWKVNVVLKYNDNLQITWRTNWLTLEALLSFLCISPITSSWQHSSECSWLDWWPGAADIPLPDVFWWQQEKDPWDAPSFLKLMEPSLQTDLLLPSYADRIWCRRVWCPYRLDLYKAWRIY